MIVTTNPQHGSGGLFRSRGGIVLIGFAVVAAFCLRTEHRAHLLGVLPWLLILACPLTHIFMHGGHGGHGGHPDHAQSSPSAKGQDT
jgi:hypothetical protein